KYDLSGFLIGWIVIRSEAAIIVIEVGLAIHAKHAVVVHLAHRFGCRHIRSLTMLLIDLGEQNLKEIWDRRADQIQHLVTYRAVERHPVRSCKRLKEVVGNVRRKRLDLEMLEIVDRADLADPVQHVADADGPRNQKPQIPRS